MKKACLFILLIFCSSYSCIVASAQQGQQGSQSKQGSTLPPPLKIEAAGLEKAEPPPPSRVVRLPCDADSVTGANLHYEIIKQEPRIGLRIEGYPKSNLGNGGSVVGARELLVRYRVIFDDIKYDVIVGEFKNTIKRINTADSGFKTPEGIAVGDVLEKVLNVSKDKPVKVKMCFYEVELKSGWHAFFGQENILADGTLATDARVNGFFKRN